MKKFISTISLLYSIPVNRIVTLKEEKVFFIESDGRPLVLKLLDFSEEEVDFITEAMNYLSERGFHRFNEIIPTAGGALAGSIGRRKTLLTAALPGRAPSYEKEADVAVIAAFLADLHRAAEGFHAKASDSPRQKWGQMISAMANGKRELTAFQEALRGKERLDEFDEGFLANVGEAIAEIDAATAELATFYPALSEELEQRGGFCHHDPAHHNFVIDGKGNAGVFDFDYTIADLAAHDVAALLLKILKTNHWQTANAKGALRHYVNNRPLTEGERRFIHCLLRYPYDFHHAALARYSQGNRSRRVEKKMRRLIEEKPLRERALDELADEGRP